MTSTTALPLDFGTPGADPQQLCSIPLDALRIDSDFPVRKHDPEALDALAKSLEIVGQIQPIGVRAAGRNWTLVYGERRVRAARLLGRSTLLARIYSPIGAAPVVLRATENMHRQEYSLEDAADTVLRLIEAGMTAPSIAKALARREAWVNSMLSFSRNPLARELASLGRLQSVSAWESFATLDQAEQRVVLDSSDTITVARCDEARQASRQKEARRQRLLAPAAPETPPSAPPAEGDAEQTCAQACASVEPDIGWRKENPATPDDSITVTLRHGQKQALQRIMAEDNRELGEILQEAVDVYLTHRQGAGHE
ncbi:MULTISPECIES: ParB/RepB/Spo0J family partition protein [Thiomonas]|uniref:ParB/RepB/Spo0J family partition protein n=1 Tax=Thiomonas TaxID=32012 RepID=UPI001AD1F10E|nr:MULTISPECIES: ParB N-terminal domain-containing protein [Thiomonas]MBN8777508.1 ParB N-terminal domain-containing protein [Thiomonas arsenitoxydans]